MNLIKYLLILIPSLVLAQSPTSISILASDYMIFSPSEVTISINDTVFFQNLGNHNAVEVSEETYNNDGILSNGGFEYYTDNYHVFTEVGTYYYVCTPHITMGMKGIIHVVENQESNLVGQWYNQDFGDYLEFSNDSVFFYSFEYVDCYYVESNSYEFNDSILVINYEDEESMNILISDLSEESFTLTFDDNSTTSVSSTSFDPNEWTECNEEFFQICDSIELTSVFIDSTSNEIIFEIFNNSSLDINYPYISTTTNGNNEPIQNGDFNLYQSGAGETSVYSYLLNDNYTIIYPLTITFTYTNEFSFEENTCSIEYNINMPTGLIPYKNKSKLLQVLDLSGKKSRLLKNMPQLHIYEDGRVIKKMIID